MHLHQEHHHFLQFFFEHRKLTELYTVIGIRSLAVSMIAIFLPIYIYLLRNSVFDVLTFYFYLFVTVIVLFPVADFIASKIGNVHMDLVSAPFGIAFYLSIYFFDPIMIGIPILGILHGAFDTFFWAFFHGEFSFISDKNLISREVSGWRAFSFFVGLFGPFTGGIIISLFGFELLFVVVAFLLILSPLPLLFSKDIKIKSQMKMKEIFSVKHLKMAPAYIGHGASSVACTIVWPLFIYFIIPDFFQIGSMSLIINSVSAIVALIVGVKVVKWGKIKLIRIGGVMFAVSIVLRAFVSTTVMALGAWSLGALSFPIVSIPTESLNYAMSKRENMMELFTFREWMLGVGRLTTLGVVAFFLLTFPLQLALQFTFVYAVTITLLMATMK